MKLSEILRDRIISTNWLLSLTQEDLKDLKCQVDEVISLRLKLQLDRQNRERYNI
jgi:hypothetical protein